jgi:hypothetical protein
MSSTPESSSSPPSHVQRNNTVANAISAVKWGLIVSVAYYLIELGITALVNLILNVNNDPTKNPLVLLPLCSGIFVYIFALYVAGYMPAAERGNVSAGIFGAALMYIISTILQKIYIPAANTPAKSAPTSTLISPIFAQLLGLLFALAIALGIGYLGAFYGVKRNSRTNPATKV